MILLQQAQHFIRIGRGVHLFHVLGAVHLSLRVLPSPAPFMDIPSKHGRKPVIAETRS